MQAMEIARTGMDVEWRRLDVIADNIANANTVRTASGAPYRALRLLSGPKDGFERALASGDTTGLRGVESYSLEAINLPPRRVYEPDNPQADPDGFVGYPAFSHAEQMTLLVKTARAYEANLVVMNAARQMYLRAMDLGKNA